MPSIWHAPAGTIPSAEAVQARAHPCGQSLPSSLTRPLSHAASRAERFRTLLPLIPHVATATMAQPQVRSASLQSQAPQRKQQQLRVRSRPSPPLRSYPVRPQRTRSRVPMTRRFLHNAPWLSSVSRCLGPTQRRDPVSSSIGGQPHQLIAQRRPITASSKSSHRCARQAAALGFLGFCVVGGSADGRIIMPSGFFLAPDLTSEAIAPNPAKDILVTNVAAN